MTIPERASVYFIIFYLSCLLLTLQIILSLLFKVMTMIPFLAISFAFLGMSVAGLIFYLHYYDRPIDNPKKFISTLSL